MGEALAVKTENKPVVYNPAIMDEMEIDAKDIILSRVLCMNGMSPLVVQGKATVGELRDSVTGALLCEKDQSLEAIFYNPFKTWVVFQGDVFDSIHAYTKENADWQWEEKVGDKVIKRKKTLNYYVALPKDIEAGTYVPKVISFQSIGYKYGKKIESRRIHLKRFGKPLATQVFQISSLQHQKDSKTWFLIDPLSKRDSTVEEINAISEWAEIMKTKTVELDNDQYDKTEEGYEGRDF